MYPHITSCYLLFCTVWLMDVAWNQVLYLGLPPNQCLHLD